MSAHDPTTQKIVERVQKLLRLAERGGTEAEAASAAAKAQELLDAYNLDMATVERAGGSADGRREDAMVRGGMYRWQRELWQACADLNHCFYFSTRHRVERRAAKIDPVSGFTLRKAYRPWSWQHRVVGRIVNTTASRNLASYLEQTIERLAREAIQGDNTQLFSSWAVSWREGAVDRVVARVQERALADRERREAEAAERAARAGISTERALTLADVAEREEQGNYDFIHGDGAWAKQQEWEAGREKRRAAARASAEAEYTAWASAHPEEAAKEAAKERARERRASSRRTTYRDRAPSAADRRRWSDGYVAGRKAGDGIGLDPQTAGRTQGRIGHG